MIKLIGILIVAAGFALRLNPLLVVVAAGVATGLVAGLSLTEVLALLGTYFVENRFMTLPVLLMLPVVGLLERHGLQERVATLIRRSATATAGRVMFAYHALRAAASTVAVNIGTHASMVRPMIAPMAEGAAARRETPGEKGTAEIRAHAAAAETLGNFFADDILVAVGPVLLIKGVLDAAGVRADLLAIAWWGAPTALWVMFVGAWRYRALDRRLEGRGR